MGVGLSAESDFPGGSAELMAFGLSSAALTCGVVTDTMISSRHACSGTNFQQLKQVAALRFIRGPRFSPTKLLVAGSFSALFDSLVLFSEIEKGPARTRTAVATGVASHQGLGLSRAGFPDLLVAVMFDCLRLLLVKLSELRSTRMIYT